MKANPRHAHVVKTLDDLLAMPRPLSVTYEEAGAINAWYSPGQHSVTMTYDLAHYLSDLFQKVGHPKQRADELADEAMVFILLHELGHAVIGELGLPTTGREEDSADEFATILARQIDRRTVGGS